LVRNSKQKRQLWKIQMYMGNNINFSLKEISWVCGLGSCDLG
jgi:hypothetical protein